MTPEAKARQTIDALLAQAGWHVCDMAQANIHAARGVALREFPLNAGYGFADYLLYIDGRAAGVIEAKKAGSTLTGVEVQSARYAQGLPDSLPAWLRPLPFSYESTGIETHFTQGLDPQPRARSVFAFHRPETLAALLSDATAVHPLGASPALHTGGSAPAAAAAEASPGFAATFLGRLQTIPQLVEDDRADMQVFLDNMLGMLPVLGIHAFEQVKRAAQAPQATTPALSDAIGDSMDPVAQQESIGQEVLLTCRAKGFAATGFDSAQGFVVLAGSQAAGNTGVSLAPKLVAARQELLHRDVLAEAGNVLSFTQDYVFSSPSYAASMILGRSANGRRNWQDAQGRTLKELQALEANA
ncbi:MAG: DUF4357 domain-containing protein [Rhodoferax sp.]|nr:DUF4357 domain-containing protein [Rhodoferax sp.]HQX58522.1 DUF4357 domain-containing protein [Burkholderiaceae bacterium]